MTRRPPSAEQEYADKVVESFCSSIDDHYFAELWVGRWTSAHGRPVLITAGRSKERKYVEALGWNISPNGSPGRAYYDLALQIYENAEEPNPCKYQHGMVLIGGEEADSLNDAWQDDLTLSAQWGGLTRYV